MDVIHHASFVAVLAWIGAVMVAVGFAATEAEDRNSFKVMGAIVMLTVVALLFLGR